MTEMRGFIFICLACLAFLTGSGDVLLWTVDGDATVDGGGASVYALLSPVPDDDLHFPAARVKISGGGLTSPIYLDNYWSDKDTGEWGLEGGDVGVWVGDSGSGYYGAMLKQSHVPSELAMEALFSIEIGKMTWDDDTYMSGAFQVLAESDKYTYEQVRAYMYPTFDLNPPVTDWIPTQYHTTPEPSTSLLCIIGFGVLMLKRKPCHG